MLSVDALGLLLGVLQLRVAGRVQPSMSMAVDFAFMQTSPTDNIKLTEFGGSTGIFFHFKPEALKGFYIGPTVGWLNRVAEVTFKDYDPYLNIWIDETETGFGTFFLLNGTIGYRWIAKSGFALDLSTGLTYRIGYLAVADNIIAQSGWLFGGLGIGLGYAF